MVLVEGGTVAAIVSAIIAGIVAIVVGYWQFRKPPSYGEGRVYSGRVINSQTQQSIQGAKISLETTGIPRSQFTDTEGVYSIATAASSSPQEATLRIEAAGFKPTTRLVSSGVFEDIRLELQGVQPSRSPGSGKLEILLFIVLADERQGPIHFTIYDHHLPSILTSFTMDDPLQLPKSMRTKAPRYLFSLDSRKFLDENKIYREQQVISGARLILTDMTDIQRLVLIGLMLPWDRKK